MEQDEYTILLRDLVRRLGELEREKIPQRLKTIERVVYGVLGLFFATIGGAILNKFLALVGL